MSALPASCVVDASVGIRLFLSEEHSQTVQELFEQRLLLPRESLFVPDLFFIECANILWKKVRRGEYGADDALSHLADLRALALSATPSSELMERALEIACAHDVTAYDASYIALAEMRAVPFVTTDDRLADKLEGTPHEIITLCQLA